jgi:hypothetical protein
MKNYCILLFSPYAHLRAVYKVSSLYDQPSQRSAHKLFHTLHPSWIHHNSKNNYLIILSSQYTHLLMIMKHCTKFQSCLWSVFMISHLRGELSTSCFTPSPSWINHNSTKNNWILLSWQYAHLLVIMKHCTKFQISTISHLVGDVSTRQTYRKYINTCLHILY